MTSQIISAKFVLQVIMTERKHVGVLPNKRENSFMFHSKYCLAYAYMYTIFCWLNSKLFVAFKDKMKNGEDPRTVHHINSHCEHHSNLSKCYM